MNKRGTLNAADIFGFVEKRMPVLAQEYQGAGE